MSVHKEKCVGSTDALLCFFRIWKPLASCGTAAPCSGSSIEEKMEEIRLVNRAKWLLIENLKMTESDAHHYIEKQAMDRCSSKKEIALGIIKTYS